ncbi:hypothetical protein DesLBE_1941 [Desulfitobacterium sp. LBE]|uniref:Uncharacterized protein n=2 Tax=Desulfitobacterium TaxID=36853 RepID=A0A098B714_DESHA|nr:MULTISPECIES: hypothetical protein [Desulfitobacterium]TWH57652.1 hypothetical protein DesLBE_1941 [Desulfitobacterium sp. LBE]CDX04137.1 Hypothetical protein DPCES_4251 [Desulfitobacterium hafniense]SHN66084.1 hypothetical protein SAMN02745215_01615 [Desulfitobacterium chlororespirans DSM 11544]
MIGRKIYYELPTGNVVLTTLEKLNGIDTTKEQDLAMYQALQAYSPESIGVIQLEYGQYSSDFLTANSWRVDLATGNLVFNYPIFEQPLSVKVDRLEAENNSLKQESLSIKLAIAELASTQEMDKMEIQLALAELGSMIGGAE